jgi:hypothetical protein
MRDRRGHRYTGSFPQAHTHAYTQPRIAPYLKRKRFHAVCRRTCHRSDMPTSVSPRSDVPARYQQPTLPRLFFPLLNQQKKLGNLLFGFILSFCTLRPGKQERRCENHTSGLFDTRDDRCEDGRIPVSANCLISSNPDSLSNSETGVDPGIRS